MQAPALSRPAAPARALAWAGRAPPRLPRPSLASHQRSAAVPRRPRPGAPPPAPAAAPGLPAPPPPLPVTWAAARRRRREGGRSPVPRPPCAAGGLRNRARRSGRRASARRPVRRRRRPRPPPPGGQSLHRPPGKRGGSAASSSLLSPPWLPTTQQRRAGVGLEKCLLDRRVDGLRARTRLGEWGCLLDRSVPIWGTPCRFPGPLLIQAVCRIAGPGGRSVFAGYSFLAGSPGAIPPTSFRAIYHRPLLCVKPW